MKESFSSASSMSPGNANRKKEILYCLTALIQSYEDRIRMNRSLGSDSSCTYHRNYSSSKPKSDHSIKEQETIRNVLELLHANPMPLVVATAYSSNNGNPPYSRMLQLEIASLSSGLHRRFDNFISLDIILNGRLQPLPSRLRWSKVA